MIVFPLQTATTISMEPKTWTLLYYVGWTASMCRYLSRIFIPHIYCFLLSLSPVFAPLYLSSSFFYRSLCLSVKSLWLFNCECENPLCVKDLWGGERGVGDLSRTTLAALGCLPIRSSASSSDKQFLILEQKKKSCRYSNAFPDIPTCASDKAKGKRQIVSTLCAAKKVAAAVWGGACMQSDKSPFEIDRLRFQFYFFLSRALSTHSPSLELFSVCSSVNAINSLRLQVKGECSEPADAGEDRKRKVKTEDATWK